MDNANIHGLDDALRKLKQAKNYLNTGVQRVIGTLAVEHFKENFEKEGSNGKKWASRKTRVKLDKKILTGQNSDDHLSESIDFRVNGNTVTVYTDKEYAQVHNEGFDGTQKVPEHKRSRNGKIENVRAHDRHMIMPKREFMGDSPELIDKITQKITRDLTRLLT